MLSEISRLNFININAYKFGQPAIFANGVKRGVCKMGKWGWKNAERRQKKVKRIKREMRRAKINIKINKKRKEIFLSSRCREVGSFMYRMRYKSIVGTGYVGFFLNSLNPVISFINVTETRTLRSSSLKPRMLWCTSPLST